MRTNNENYSIMEKINANSNSINVNIKHIKIDFYDYQIVFCRGIRLHTKRIYTTSPYNLELKFRIYIP